MMPETRAAVRDETRSEIWKRRALTVPIVGLAFFLAVLLAPIWIPVLFVVDLANGFRTTVLRSFLFLTVYLGCEVVGVTVSGWLWIRGALGGPASRGGDLDFERHFSLQRWWAGTLLHWVLRIFRVSIRVEGEEVLDRPMILMLRHTSIADTLLANEFISAPHRIHLRHILKRELLVDPCLDIVGHRLPNYFVDRESDDPAEELAGVKTLLSGLRENEGALIYPEGTRFTPEKRSRIIERLSAQGKDELADRARSLHHLLPPRLGGSLALLEENPGLDAVFCAHTGFESVGRPADVLGGSLLDGEVKVRFWRIPYGEIPVESTARSRWLFEQWLKMDAWVGSNGSRA